MSKTRIVLACLFLCSALLMTAAAQQKNNYIPATSTIFAPFRIMSDGLGTYADSPGILLSGVGLGKNYGTWALTTDLTNGTTPTPRKIKIDLGDPVDSNTTPFEPQTVWARLVARCTDYGQSNNMLDMQLDQQIYSPLLIQFQLSGNGTNYYIYMDPNDPKGINTNSVSISCIGVAPTGSQCNGWTIKPSPLSGKNIGRVWKTASNPSKVIDLGRFYFSFSFSVSIP